MNFLKGNVKQLYGKYLMASLCSALVMSVYSSVDAIAVGQSEGPLGAAAMAVITPLYGVMAVFSIMIGIGGSVLLGNARGEGDEKKANSYFTNAVVIMGIVTVILWILFTLFSKPIFTFFGADEQLLPKVMEYAVWLIRFFPVFLFSMFIGAFVRNDGAPTLAMAAVITGGVINIFLDWYLVFPLNMGMTGAALATVTGTCVQLIVLCSHFFRKKCSLKLVKPCHFANAVKNICQIGIGAGVLDAGNIFLAIMMNNQIMKYGGTNELAVYGVIVTITSLFQALFNGVGQAIQPLVSVNFGAKQTERVMTFWKMSLKTVILMGILFLVIGEAAPTAIIKLFIDATPDVIAVAPEIVRLYFIMFIPLGVTVLATYYLQSTLHDKMSMVIAILRSMVLSGVMIYVLPMLLELTGIWIALPISETIVAIFALWFIVKKINSVVLLP